ncbi:HET-domain-containing protein [Podospora fimiseda]|uniref:HET-domain-containing protein n=1 Tax=Podospora fimiseda TaxID=252190 RepID=A0AAN6YPA1_9PEZI|nr:HET-domain-containing protein [Podospora fimiseda]
MTFKPQRDADDLYRHVPLPPTNTIRVLQLLPHPDKDAPVDCRLTTLSFGSSEGIRSYEALSYSWGSTVDPKPITVNGHWQILIGWNLHTALMQLRDASIGRKLWIDAICINQAGHAEALEERSRQVQSIAKAYAQATQVLVWLGDAADNSDRALDDIQSAAAVAESGTSPSPPVVDEESILKLHGRSWFGQRPTD